MPRPRLFTLYYGPPSPCRADLFEFKFKCADEANLFYWCACGAVRGGFVIAVSAENLNVSLIGTAYSADAHS